ncbi:MAG: DUF4157 domain-containing protein [Cyanobacteria bacterium P01_A01_bin.15]
MTKSHQPAAKQSAAPPVVTAASCLQLRPFAPRQDDLEQDGMADLMARAMGTQLMDMPVDAPGAAVQRQAIPEEEEELTVQPKLSIGQPGDKYEQEADQMAARVMRMPDGDFGVEGKGKGEGVQRQALPGEKEEEEVQTKSAVQREVMPGEKEEETLQARLQAKGEAPAVPENFEGQLANHKGGGRSLSDETRGFMEPRFGADFSNVRIHETPDLANAIQAQAFTHGQDIYFNSGKYSPGSRGGKELLAHELMHTLQQEEGISLSVLQCRDNESIRQNSMSSLKKIRSIEKLLRLFVTNRKTFWIGPVDRSNSFTKRWIQGDGQEAIKDEIRRRLSLKRKQGNQIHIEYFLEYINNIDGNENRKVWLRNVVKYHLRLMEVSTSSTDGRYVVTQFGSYFIVSDSTNVSFHNDTGEQITESEFINLETVWNALRSNSKSIKISERDKTGATHSGFRRTILLQFAKLLSKPKGRKLVTELTWSSQQILIRPSSERLYGGMGTGRMSSGFLENPDGTSSVGGSSFLEIDDDLRDHHTLVKDANGNYISSPVFLGIGHELIHAQHNATGRNRREFPASYDSYPNREEFETVEGGAITENDLRVEHGFSTRRHGHSGRDRRFDD